MEANKELFQDEIADAHNSLCNAEISIVSMIDQLQDVIVAAYNGVWFEDYKSEWAKRIYDYFKESRVTYVKKTPDWNRITSMIIAKLCSGDYDFKGKNRAAAAQSQLYAAPICPVSGPVCNPASATANETTPVSGPDSATANSNTPGPTTIPKASRRSSASTSASTSAFTSSSASTSITESTVSPSEESIKLPKLTDADKDRVIAVYNCLDKSKMWRLSTGTYVEEKMLECALEKNYEHLAHSLILNVKDNDWYKYFSRAEMDEIAGYRAVDFPSLPELDTYLNELKSLSPQDLYTKLVSEELPIESTNKWIQDSFYQCLRLLKSGFFPINGITESGLGKRIWSCVDTCFDFSDITCIFGEKCSKASADAMNANRTSLLSRQSLGRKMDYLFQERGKTEVGCGECGLVGGVNTTKELHDATLKMPKVMKEMMIHLLSLSPSLKRDLVLSGFYIGENKLTLYALDCPSGYVTRYDAFKPVFYPDNESQLYRKLSAVLKVIFAGRILMESTALKLDNDSSEIAIGRDQDEGLVPCFMPASTNKKRKR